LESVDPNTATWRARSAGPGGLSRPNPPQARVPRGWSLGALGETSQRIEQDLMEKAFSHFARSVSINCRSNCKSVLFRIASISLAVVLVLPSVANASPILRVQGVIGEVGEGFILLVPDGGGSPLRFILRWKARFVPPKLPLEGDRVLILYKDKDEGAVIYGVEYLGSPADLSVPKSDRLSDQ